MKLELKHIAPYLAYELECECPLLTEDREGSKICDIVGAFSDWVAIARKDSAVHDEFEYHEFKILLRPMSDITKEIEHNGEKFVPILEICSQEYGYTVMNGNLYKLLPDDYHKEQVPLTDCRFVENWITNLLAEWHFNYMNLDESLWIHKK